MGSQDQRARYVSVTAGARVFALILLSGPVAVTSDFAGIINLVLLATIWMGAVLGEGLRHIPVMPALVVETSLATFMVALNLEHSGTLLPALVVAPFVAGLVRGVRGAFEALGAEVAILAATLLPNANIDVDAQLLSVLFTWLMVSLGVGLMAAVIHRTRSESDMAANYREARTLINQLLELSGQLVDGLDAVSIGQNIVDLSREEVPLSACAVYLRSPNGITILLDAGLVDDGMKVPEVVTRSFRSGKPSIDGEWAAFPLVTDADTVAVVAGSLGNGVTPPRSALRDALAQLTEMLRPEALQLDAALLFSAVKDQATAEERRRLARDLHDGVAQDLASLGYMIDELAETSADREQATRCHALRDELTKVVAELRRSVFSLRNETNGAASLGEAITVLAGHIGNRSGITVDIDLDESEDRLRPDVEAELLRIAQEGMNNAVKHARASRITVSCRVSPPAAEIVVSDDGRGLQTGRPDSHGVRIMRERARRIGAQLHLGSPEGRGGTELRVVLAGPVHSGGRPGKLEGMATQ